MNFHECIISVNKCIYNYPFWQLQSSGWKSERLLTPSIIWRANWRHDTLNRKVDWKFCARHSPDSSFCHLYGIRSWSNRCTKKLEILESRMLPVKFLWRQKVEEKYKFWRWGGTVTDFVRSCLIKEQGVW